jgi:hypothetical protein
MHEQYISGGLVRSVNCCHHGRHATLFSAVNDSAGLTKGGYHTWAHIVIVVVIRQNVQRAPPMFVWLVAEFFGAHLKQLMQDQSHLPPPGL